MDVETLRQALLSGVQSAAANSKDIGSLVPLLVLEIGLLNDPHYDMLKDVPKEQLNFTALQKFLIFADIFVPLIRELSADKASSVLENSAALIQAKGIPLGNCAGIEGLKGLSPFTKWAGKIILGLATKGGPVVVGIYDELHGSMIAYSVRVSNLTGTTQKTHYGPAGHDKNAGNELRFQLKVEMLDDFGERIVNCGVLAGAQFPPKGPIRGVSVGWDEDLGKYGTVSYDPPDETTGPDGISTLIFKPKDEKFPGQGKLTTVEGEFTAIAYYQTALGNIFGSVAQFSKRYPFPYRIEFHETSLSGTLRIIYDETPNNSDKFHAEADVFFTVGEDGRITCNGGTSYCSGKAQGTMTENGSCTGTYKGEWEYEFTGYFLDDLTFEFSPYLMTYAGTRCCPNNDPPCRPFDFTALGGIPDVTMPPQTGITYKIPFEGGGWTFELIDLSVE